MHGAGGMGRVVLSYRVVRLPYQSVSIPSVPFTDNR